MFEKQSKEYRLDDLSQATQFCDLCPRMSQRTRVLSSANGDVNSKILFVAEAPGRLGADKTGIPLYGDKTGDNFERLLGNIGWQRKDVFVTNAILCNPRTENGNNGTPSSEEISNCSSFLEMTINLIKPDVIVSLGRIALDALQIIHPHNYTLNENAATMVDFNGLRLYPLYHPGPRAMVHRNRHKQTADFFKLSRLVDPKKGLIPIKNGIKYKPKMPQIISWQKIHQIIYIIINVIQNISLFKMTKLLYLIDLSALEKLKYSLTAQTYLRQQEGPWMPHLKKCINQMNNHELEMFFRMNKPMIKSGASPRFRVSLADEEISVITDILNKYGAMSDAALKTAVYRTKQMQEILKQEHLGKKTKNTAIIHKNNTILENNVSL